MINYVTIDDVLAIRDQVAAAYPHGDSFDIMSRHGLLSALAAPRQSAFGAEAFPSLDAKAAALLYHLVQNHPFWDSNKRIAAAAMQLFLRKNNRSLAASDAELEQLTVLVASGKARQEQIALWLRQHGVAD